MDDLKDWTDHGLPISTVTYTASLAGNATMTLIGTKPVLVTKKAKDA